MRKKVFSYERCISSDSDRDNRKKGDPGYPGFSEKKHPEPD